MKTNSATRGRVPATLPMVVAALLLFLVVAAESSAQQDAKVTVENNRQRAGGDYTNFVSIGAEQCAQECAKDVRCLAFDFSRYDRRCWLKSTVPQAMENRDVVSGVKQESNPITAAMEIEGIRVEPNRQRAGGDYSNFVTSGPEQCAGACAREVACLAFDFSRYDRRCWLKSTVPAARENSGVVSGVKQDSIPRTQPIEIAGIRLEPSSQRAGGDYTNFATSGPEQCAQECAADIRCRAFDYSRHDQRCWLKSIVPQARMNPDVVSGVKKKTGSGSGEIVIAGIRIEQNTQRAFGDYTSFRSSGFEQCAMECAADSRCLAFDYSRHDTTCWLKNSVPPARVNPDVVSGIK